MSNEGPREATSSPRRERARGTIAEALLALVREGDLAPTAQRIAERAGVSLRLVFHHFEDLEALHREMGSRQADAVRAMLRPIDPALPFAERLPEFVRERARVLEFITPVRRAALLHAPFSPAIADAIAEIRDAKRDQTLAVFAPELDALAPFERSLVEPLLASIASWSSWEELRAHRRVGVRRAREVIELGLARTLRKETPS